MQDLENAVREVLETTACPPNARFLCALVNLRIMFDEHMAKVDDLTKENAEIARLQGELSAANHENHRLTKSLEYWSDSSRAHLQEILRLQQELRDLKGDRAILMSNAAEIREAAGTKTHDAIIMKLRDHEAAMRFKREVADIAGTGAYKCDDIRDALKAKVDKLAGLASEAAERTAEIAEYRAAWAKLKGMLE